MASPSGHGSAASERCAAATAADGGDGIGEHGEQRVALGALLEPAVRRERGADEPRCRASSGSQAAVPRASTSRVDPSMSVNRNVTSPVGGQGQPCSMALCRQP